MWWLKNGNVNGNADIATTFQNTDVNTFVGSAKIDRDSLRFA